MHVYFWYSSQTLCTEAWLFSARYVLYSGAQQRVNRHKSAKLANQNVTRWMKSFETVHEWLFFIPAIFFWLKMLNRTRKCLDLRMTYANFDVFANEFSSELSPWLSRLIISSTSLADIYTGNKV